MSFSIEAAGTVEQVEMQLATATIHGDTSQVDAVRAFIARELEQWPTVAPTSSHVIGAYVRASGHHGDGARNVNLEMRPLYLLKTPEGTE